MKTQIEPRQYTVELHTEGGNHIGTVDLLVPMQWEEELQEWLLTPEAHRAIEMRQLQVSVAYLLRAIENLEMSLARVERGLSGKQDRED